MKLIKQMVFWIIGIIHFTLLGQNNFFDSANSFFNQQVRDGLVDYSSIFSDQKELDILIGSIESFDIESATKDEQLSFYINAYNLLVIKNVIDHFPINSPMDVPGFFEKKRFKVAHKELSLNELENEIIRPEFNDPRIHFALVCGAISCPPIIPMAYFPKNVHELLDRQTNSAIEDSNFTIVNKQEVSLSQIFNWYKIDFGGNDEAIIQFINQYREKKVLSNSRINYYHYDWKLNIQ